MQWTFPCSHFSHFQDCREFRGDPISLNHQHTYRDVIKEVDSSWEQDTRSKVSCLNSRRLQLLWNSHYCVIQSGMPSCKMLHSFHPKPKKFEELHAFENLRMCHCKPFWTSWPQHYELLLEKYYVFILQGCNLLCHHCVPKSKRQNVIQRVHGTQTTSSEGKNCCWRAAMLPSMTDKHVSLVMS